MKDESALRERFTALRAQGWSYNRLTTELGVSKPTLIKWGRELAAEIADRKDPELEALYEQYYMTTEGRIRLLGERLKALKDEAEKRPLVGIPTGKLYDLIERYTALLKDETEDLTFRTEAERDRDKAEARDWKKLLGVTT